MGTGSGRELVALMDADRELTDTDKALVEVFCSRLSAAFDNVTLYEELERANLRWRRRSRGAPRSSSPPRSGSRTRASG